MDRYRPLCVRAHPPYPPRACDHRPHAPCVCARVTLNILLSFAQFEREIISERTRDKIAGARRRGKWAGGRPVLGYDLVPGRGGSKLEVNASEAERVRAIFSLYLASEGGITPVVSHATALENDLQHSTPARGVGTLAGGVRLGWR